MAAEFAQLRVELAHRRADEFDPPVGARQGIQYLAVEYKDAVHLPAGFQRQAQGGVIGHAQIATQPE